MEKNNEFTRIGTFCERCRNVSCICKIGENTSIIKATLFNEEEYLNENIDNKNYYTTSRPITINDFIGLEVDDRGNYDIDDVNGWINKYNIRPNTKIIWVTLEPYIAARYEMDGEDWDNAEKIYNENPNDFNVKIIDSKDGFLIPETDDGDDGFIFVYR